MIKLGTVEGGTTVTKVMMHGTKTSWSFLSKKAAAMGREKMSPL